MRDYRGKYFTSAKLDIDFYRKLKSVKAALKAASRCQRFDGKRHSHQTRLKTSAFRLFGRKIRAMNVAGLSDFDELYAMVSKLAVPGIGPLTIYDTAQRIGWHLNVDPDKIYLHSGVTEGALNLGLSVRGKTYLTMGEVPASFRRLRPDQIEDLLCIYKDELSRFAVR